MDLVVGFFGFILYISSISAFRDLTAEEYYDYTLEDSEQTDPPVRPKPRTKPPTTSYEVTEKVDDIPDPRTAPFPVANNFTLNKPLNLAGANSTGNVDISNRENPKFRRDFTDTPVLFEPVDNGSNVNQNTYKKPEVELDDDVGFNSDEDDGKHHEDIHHMPNILPYIRRYLEGFEKGILQGLNSLAGNVFKGVKVNEPYSVDTPVSLINKLKYGKGQEQNEKSLRSYLDDAIDD